MHFSQQHTEKLEQMIDAMNVWLPDLRNFIAPNGPIDLARSQTRMVEQFALDFLDERENADFSWFFENFDWQDAENILQFLNRLSDYLFTLGRFHRFVIRKEDVKLFQN